MYSVFLFGSLCITDFCLFVDFLAVSNVFVFLVLLHLVGHPVFWPIGDGVGILVQ